MTRGGGLKRHMMIRSSVGRDKKRVKLSRGITKLVGVDDIVAFGENRCRFCISLAENHIKIGGIENIGTKDPFWNSGRLRHIGQLARQWPASLKQTVKTIGRHLLSTFH